MENVQIDTKFYLVIKQENKQLKLVHVQVDFKLSMFDYQTRTVAYALH